MLADNIAVLASAAEGLPRGRAASSELHLPPNTNGGKPLWWVDRFKYLGAHITATGELDSELLAAAG